MSTIPERKDVPASDQWDLSVLYSSPEAWDTELERLKTLLPSVEPLRGTLARSKADLRKVLDLQTQWERLGEKLGQYAHLRTAEDVADGPSNERMGRFMSVATQFGAAFSFVIPEIQAIDDETWSQWMADPQFADDRVVLAKVRRERPHILGIEAERVLALAAESNGAVRKAFSSLTNADLDFGTVNVNGESLPLTQSTWSVFVQNPDPDFRKRAYDQFYAEYAAHANVLATLYAGSIHQDVASARQRNYASSRARALFGDDVPEAVYDNLVSSVHEALPQLHRYYDLRRRLLGLEKLRHCDVYAPMIPGVETKHSYDEAVTLVLQAVRPLGDEYVRTMGEGLRGGWVDRYENKGKRAGAFSSGAYEGPPYILLNYKEDSLRDVFTLAHEAGHSMHSWYSVRSNPFQHYSYTIFEAEVASTFNEQLLAKSLLEKSTDQQRAYILSKQIEDTVATLYRQTMFAEFEHKAHAHAEAGGGLTLDYFKQTYRELLELYFGPEVELGENSSLEGLRIPHFYGAFYVYKYATGLSAAMALAARVLGGGAAERDQYLSFLKSGGSRFPLESLKLAGVDMASPEPVRNALRVFSGYLDQLEELTSR